MIYLVHLLVWYSKWIFKMHGATIKTKKKKLNVHCHTRLHYVQRDGKANLYCLHDNATLSWARTEYFRLLSYRITRAEFLRATFVWNSFGFDRHLNVHARNTSRKAVQKRLNLMKIGSDDLELLHAYVQTAKLARTVRVRRLHINTQCVYPHKFAANTERRSVFRVARVQHLLLSATLCGLGKPTCHTHQWRKPVCFYELLLGKFNFEKW
jgi:hypothetical protein